MPKNADSLNRSLFELLQSKGYDPTMLSTAGKEIPTPEEAEVFQFNFIKDGEDYGKVTMSIDGLHKLIIYYDDEIANSEKEESESGDLSWYQLLNQLKRFAQKYQLSFELRNVSNLKHDMAKREYMKKKESIAEGYYPMGKKASYSDAVPSVKIVLQHTRQIEEGEQRYRNVAKIFLENEHGERFLAPTVKPGIARVYARHLAEGGLANDERWNHIKSLCEEYQKMAGFVRATRSGQFNESTQKLIAEGINHYQSLRESLGKLAGHRGYNAYFESWTPTLMEDDSDTSTLNELFVQETVDPRIESVMPILARLHKNISEMSEVNELAEWADKLVEDDTDIEDNEIEDAADKAEQDLTEAPGAETLAHNEKTEAGNLKAFGLAEDEVEESFMDTLKKAGKKVVDYIAPSDEDLLKDLQKKAGIPPHAQHGKKRMAVPNDELKEMPDTQFHEEDMSEALDPEKKRRLYDLIELYSNATDPEADLDFEVEPEEIIATIRKEFGDSTANSVEQGPSMHFPRPGHSSGFDPLKWKQPVDRITKAGKMYKQDMDYRKRELKSRLGISEEEVEESGLQAYLGNKKYGKEGMDALRKAGREGASKEKMAQIRAKYDKLDEVGVAEEHNNTENLSELSRELAVRAFRGAEKKADKAYTQAQHDIMSRKSSFDHPMDDPAVKKAQRQTNRFDAYIDKAAERERGMAEDLDADQKRVGQLGPYEKVGPKGAVGKLVGSESVDPKQEMLEGQEDLDAILRIIRK